MNSQLEFVCPTQGVNSQLEFVCPQQEPYGQHCAGSPTGCASGACVCVCVCSDVSRRVLATVMCVLCVCMLCVLCVYVVCVCISCMPV